MNTQAKSSVMYEQGRVVHLRKPQVKKYSVTNKILNTGKLVLPTLQGFDCIRHDEIMYLRAQSNYTEVFTRGEKHLFSKTLREIEGLLPSVSFVRVHRSYVVNVAFIKSYIRNSGYAHVVLDNKDEIPVSRTARRII